MTKRTYNPSNKRRKRKLGYFARSKDKAGKRVLKRRRAKGRKTLSR